MRVIFTFLLLFGIFNTNFSQVVQEKANCANPIPIDFTVTITSDYNGQAISCNGLCDGEITVTINGAGGGPYGFEMYDGSTTFTQAADTPGGGSVTTFTGLCADNYNFTVIDSSQLIFGSIYESCTEFGVIISPPNNIGVNVLGFQDPSCPDSCDGRIFANIGGGTAPLSILWLESGSTNASPTGVCTGINTVEVTDANGCFFTQVVDVNDPVQINFGMVIQPVTCDGVCDAQASSTPSGANGGPFNFNWYQLPGNTALGSAAGVPSFVQGSLCENIDYQLLLEDANGCPFDTVITIADAIPITLDNQVSINATCSNECNGEVTITLAGGSGNFTTIEWYEGVVGSGTLHDAGPSLNQTNLCPNTDYYVLVTDDNGCTKTFQLSQVLSPPPFNFTETHVDVTCAGFENGSINTTLTGGSPNYSYTWTSPDGGVGFSSTGPDQSTISGGTYHVVWVDNQLCTDSADIVIFEPEPIYTNGIVTNISCFDLLDGDIDITTTGGNGGYTWSWSATPNGVGSLIDPSLEDQTNLDSATYSLHIEDALGCIYDTTFTITKPGELFFNADVTQMDCFGDNDAIITINPENGVPNYVIDWGTPINSPNGPLTQSGLSEDTYNVTLTDNNGCDKDTIIDIVEPPLLDATEVHTDLTCFNSNDGTIDVSINGGTPPAAIIWTSTGTEIPGNSTFSATDLLPGSYTADITDNNGCTNTLIIIIDEPDPLSLTISGTDLTCNGVPNGSISIANLSGGTVAGSYLFDWDNDGTGDFDDSQDLTLQLAGTYCVNIQDDNGCTLNVDSCYTIIEPDSIFFNGSTHTDITCFGDNDGSISLTVSGGTEAGNYDYNWSPTPGCYSGSTVSQNISSLCPGAYQVTATDDNGCTNDTTFNIIEPLDLTITETHTNLICANINTGEINITVSGGQGTLAVTWSAVAPAIAPANGDLNPTGLAPGQYTATVTDDNNCTEQIVIDITEPTPLSLTITGTDLTCNGVPDGTLTIVPSGGTVAGSYLFDWDNDGTGDFDDTQNLNLQLAGTYCVNIQDDLGCTLALDSCFTIFEPDSIFFNGTTSSNISCFGQDDGSINTVANGGTEAIAYDFAWAPIPACASVPNTPNISGLCPGDYTVTATDDNGCTNDTTISITEPIELVLTSSSTNITCFGDNNGTITINVISGEPVVTISWTGPMAVSGFTLTNLVAGTYDATITDGSNCSQQLSFTIEEPQPLEATLTGTDLSCNGVADGSVTVAPSGGPIAATYLIDWDNDGTGDFDDPLSLNPVLAGTYCVNIQDNNGCVLALDSCITIFEPDSIFFDGSTFTDMTCFGDDDGDISLNVSGGTVAASYGFNWSPTPACYGGPTNTQNITGLCNGTYTIEVSDDNGCTNDTTFVVTEPNQLTLTTSSTDAGCGIDNGTVSATPGGGTIAGSYMVNWTGAGTGFSSSNLNETGLAPDTYTIVIEDDNGCQITANETVSTVTPPIVTIDNQTDLLCNGECIGAVQISVTGGTAPYVIDWNGINTGFNSSNEDIFALCADDYSLSVTDGNLCQEVQVISITEPDALEIISSVVTDVDCFGNLTGSIDITPAGGTIATDYVYQWSGDHSMGETTQDVGNLLPGDYCVNFMDDNGCSLALDSCYNIVEPTELVIDNMTSTDAQCNVPNGSATVVASGGTVTTDYTYLWSPSGDMTATANNILSGVHTVTVTDDNGCTVSSSVSVIPSNGPAITVDGFTDVTCAGAGNGSISTTATGGTGGLTYSWSSIPAGYTAGNVPDVFGLAGGTYVVTVTDGAACNTQEVVVIDEPAPLSVVANITDANCFGEDGTIDITVSGGTSAAGYGYDWSHNGGSAFTDPQDLTFQAGSYTVNIVDDNGCTLLGGPYDIQEPTQITLSTSNTQSACLQNDGTVTVTASNGTPGNAPNEYTYVWTDGTGVQVGNLATASGLPAGCYDVLVTENRTNGCQMATTECVSDLNGPTLTETSTNPTCNNGNDGDINLSVVSIANPVTFVWTSLNGSPISPNNISEDINTLFADEYSVVATDNNGCISGLSVTLTDPNPISIVANVTGPLCASSLDGAISITSIIDAALPIASTDWTGPNGYTSASQDINGLEIGQYCLTLIDANGCQLDTCLTLTAPQGLTVTTSSLDSDCGSPSGQVSAIASGGNPTYTYTWTPGGNGNIINGLSAGIYDLVVEDLNGCTATAQQEVFEVNGPVIAVNSTNDVDCFGNATGDIFVSVSQGTPNYTYDWDNLAGTSDPEDQTGLPAGTYVLTVTDNAGCSDVESVTLDEPSSQLAISGTQTDLLCNGGGTGEISITVTGGTADFTYNWTVGGAPHSNSSNSTGLNTISNLDALQYDVLVTDDNGCTITDSYTLIEETAINLTTSSSDASCGNSDGEVSVVATGGNDGVSYTYSWIDFNTGTALVPGNNATEPGLPSGVYEVTVTDLNNCSQTALATISDIGGPTVISSSTPVQCFGDANGTADLIVSGNPGFTFSWVGPNGYTSGLEDITSIEAGNYAITVTDINGCTTNDVVVVNGPNSALSVSGIETDLQCFNDGTGEVNVTITGGTPNYIVNWTSIGGFTATTQDINSLDADTYTIDIEDANGCTFTGTPFVVDQPNEIIITPAILQPTCGVADGSVTLTVSGGTTATDYTYAWTDVNAGTIMVGETTNTISSIDAGNYQVDITDDNGCTMSQVIAVTNDQAPTLTIVQTDIACFSNSTGEIQVTVNGTPPNTYTYDWDNDGTGDNDDTEDLTGLPAGTYNLSVFESPTGCVSVASVTLIESDELNITSNLSDLLCFNDNSGDLDITVTGGTIPYNYDWDNLAGTNNPEDQPNINAGTYQVTVTDDNGCIIIDSYEIFQPQAIDITAVITDNLCFGDALGEIDVTVSNGVAPYQYNWDTPSTNEDETLLAAGSYLFTVTDDNGCSRDSLFTVSEPNQVIFNAIVTDANCNLSDGAITTTVSGGTLTSPDYTYNWNFGGASIATTADILSRPAGTYTFSVFDDNSCQADTTVIINNINAPVITLDNITDVSCFGDNNGQINVSITGGTAPYDYLWNPNGIAQTEDLSNAPAGTYSIQVTDDAGCLSTLSGLTIDTPTQVTASTTTIDATCGICNGEATVLGSGGTGTITYLWSNGGSTTNETGLCAGLYTVQITDNNGCSINENVALNNIGGPTGETIVTTDVTCGGGNDGTADVTASGGVAPYTYFWPHNGSTNPIQNSLSAGTYFVEMADDNGCIRIAQVDIQEPTIIDVTSNINPSTCGNPDGDITISASGGVAPLSIAWTNPAGETTPGVNGLTAGIYTVVISDAAGCSITENFTISDIDAPALTLSPNDAFCNGDATGSITSTISGAVGAISYQWIDATPTNIAGETNPDLLSIAAGDYTLEATDAGTGCITLETVTVNDPDALILSIPNIVDASCDISCDGQATAVVSGGTLAYNFLWSNGTTTPTATNLCVGVSNVTVTDANGCIIQQSITIDEDFQLNATVTPTDATCGICNGEALVAPAGGSGNYGILWNDGSTALNNTALCAGIYPFEVTDNTTGCSIQLDATINNIGGPTGETITVTDVTCNGGNDGSATVTPTGGVAPYNYSWIGQGNNTNTLSNVPAGNYVLQVSDDNGCIRMVSVDIIEPDAPTVQTIVTDGTCGSADGEITFLVSGGVAPYTYNWVSGPSAVGSTNDSESALLPGIYVIDVIDGAGCVYTETIALGTTNGPALTISNNDVTCFGDDNGDATVVATGNGPFTYAWTSGGGTDTEINLAPGQYFVSVTDALGCVTNASADITTPDELTFSLPNTQDASCDIACDGQATVMVSGGTVNYSFAWDAGQTTQTATGLCVGVNSVTVTDANGCLAQTSMVVDFGNGITSTVTPIDAACGECDGEATVVPSGGSGNYTILWFDNTTGTSHTDLCAGIYPYTVTDNANGCQTDLDVTINNIDGPDNETITITDVSCAGGTDGSADVIPSGGTAPYTLFWVPTGQTTNTLTNVPAGTYNLEVTDANGCIRVVPVSINDANPMDVQYIANGTNCGASDGSIDLIVTGGLSPYTYSWSGPGGFTSINSSETNLAPGLYTVTITDDNGCIKVTQIPLTTTTPPAATVTSNPVSCFGLSDGSLTVTGAGLTFEWQDGTLGSNLNGLPGGQYFVTITETATGCINVEDGIVTEPDSLALGVQVAADPLCNGDCNGIANAIVDGGTLPYTYGWSSSANTGSSETGLCDGTITMTITDANGCTTNTDITLVEPPVLTVTVDNIVDATCVNSLDGSIDVTANGGTGVLSYNWITNPTSSFTSTDEDLTNLNPTTYELTVTDENGCTVNTTAPVDTIFIVLANAGVDTAFCSNNCAVLLGSGIGPAGLVYEWNTVPSTTPLSTADTVEVCPVLIGVEQYTLTVSDANCTHTDTVNVEMYPLPTVDAGVDIEDVLGSTVTLGGAPTGPLNSTYFWTPDTHFLTANDTTLSNPQIDLITELDYYVFVTDTNGCVNSDTIHVRPIPQIVFPNGFTPNGDGVNDDWQIDYIEQFPESVVEVYNRWGQQLFRSVGYTERWDGTYKNKLLPVGTYYYIIELNDPLFPDTYSGPITIMR